MAGCQKADRNRKSSSNVAYKAENRAQVHKDRNMKRADAQRKDDAMKNIIVPKGTARKLRREAWMLGHTYPVLPTMKFVQWELKQAAK